MTMTPARRLDRHRPAGRARLLLERNAQTGPVCHQAGAIDLDFIDVYFHANQTRPQPENLTYTGQTQASAQLRRQKYAAARSAVFALSAGAQLQFAANNGVRESVATPARRATADLQRPSAPATSPAGASVIAPRRPDQHSALALNTLDLNVPNASIGGIGLSNLIFHYDVNGDPEQGVMCPAKYWSASGTSISGRATTDPRDRRS